MLTSAAARYYGRPAYVGTATSSREVEQLVDDIRREAARLATRSRVRVVLFEAAHAEARPGIDRSGT